MLHVARNKVKICFVKIGLMDSKWSNLNAPGSIMPLSIIQLRGPLWSALLPACRKRENMHVACNKVEKCFAMIDSKISRLNAPGSFTLGVHWGVPFCLHAGKGKYFMSVITKRK